MPRCGTRWRGNGVVGINGGHGSRLISDDITDPNRSNPMGFYNDYILPRVINLAMHNKELRPIRERVVGAAEGRVLEIGVGSE
jgi:hypothetical protein